MTTDHHSAITQWIRGATTAREWEDVRAGATTIIKGDRGAMHKAWRQYRATVMGPIRSNRLSTHYLWSQVVRPLHQYEINDMDLDGQTGHLLVGLTNRFDTFFQFERYPARIDRPADFIRHCLAGVFSFLDGHNRGPGMRKCAAIVALDWDRISRAQQVTNPQPRSPTGVTD